MAKKYTRLTIKGEMFDGKKLSLAVDAMLTDVGASSVQAMKEITSDNDVSKRLSNSISWQMQNKGSNAQGEYASEDEIEKPSEVGVLYVGSDAPHAYVRDTYSGIHRTDDGSEEFIKSLSEWANQVLGISKDDPDPYNQFRFWELVKKIRDRDTPGREFVNPTANQVPDFLKKAFRQYAYLVNKKIEVRR